MNSGGPIEYDISGAETYNTILTVNVAPTDTNVIWVGTDDGLVQVTKDGGKTWTNVGGHFPGLSADQEGRVYQVADFAVRCFCTAYVTYDRHEDSTKQSRIRLQDRRLRKKTWTRIDTGLPEAAAHVVREDPSARNFLVLGTDQGLLFSRDGGASWKALKADFPTTPVYDVKFVKASHDLLVATHGRGLFVLDNISPLEGLTTEVAWDFHLFPVVPRCGRALRPVRCGARPLLGARHAQGAVIDYCAGREPIPPLRRCSEPMVPWWWSRRPRGWARGLWWRASLRRPAGGDELGGRHGLRRFVWADQDGCEPDDLGSQVEWPDAPHHRASAGRWRRWVPSWGVRPSGVAGHLHADGDRGRQERIADGGRQADPVQGGDPAKFQAQLAAGLQFRAELTALHEMLNHLVGLETQIRNAQTAVRESGDTTAVGALNRASRDLSRKLRQLKDTLYNSDQQRAAPEDDIHYLTRFADKFQSLGFSVFGGYAQPPSPQVMDEWKVERAQLDGFLATFNGILNTDVAAYNQVATTNHTPVLMGGAPVTIKAVSAR